jgi:hypothetical protein
MNQSVKRWHVALIAHGPEELRVRDDFVRPAVHALNLPVRPGMPRLGQAVINIILRTGELERMRSEDLASCAG